jgi:hypothetical protein
MSSGWEIYRFSWNPNALYCVRKNMSWASGFMHHVSLDSIFNISLSSTHSKWPSSFMLSDQNFVWPYCLFHACCMPADQGPGLLFSSLIILQTVGLLGRVISSSQGLYLNTGQHKHRINAYTPNIHALSGIRTHDSSVRASENSSCLRQSGYCDRPLWSHTFENNHPSKSCVLWKSNYKTFP